MLIKFKRKCVAIMKASAVGLKGQGMFLLMPSTCRGSHLKGSAAKLFFKVNLSAHLFAACYGAHLCPHSASKWADRDCGNQSD